MKQSNQMTHRWAQVASLTLTVALGGCSHAQATAESLRASFAERISSSSFVSDFSRDGDKLNFSGPDGKGGTVTWRVWINSVLVEPNEFDGGTPYQGQITSDWYANGEIVEFLGTMSALPKEFLDRGVAQECWAYWMEAELHWDW